jgi:hypothetical protein
MQKTATKGIKKTDLVLETRNREHTPNESPILKQDSFNIEIGDNRSTTTYGNK